MTDSSSAARIPAAPAGSHATGILKLTALFFMIVDHLGAVVFTGVPELRILGRIAFPLYCWCLVVGFHYTRSAPKYLGRILLTGILVQPLYAEVMNHRINSPNLFIAYYQKLPSVFFTLFLGLAAVWAVREKKYLSHLWAPAIALMAAIVAGADYGWWGVLLFILLYAVQDSRPGIAAVMVAYFMFWGTSYSLTKSIFGLSIDLSVLPGFLSSLLSPFLRMEAYALLSLPLILIRFKKDLKIPRWVGYALYPAHLAVLYALEQIFK